MATNMAVNTTQPLINPTYKNIVHSAMATTGLAVAAVMAPWEAVKIIGTTMLTGIGYGIVNDMVACRDCIEYFTVDHVYDGKNLKRRLINTLDPNLNALVWGTAASWSMSAAAGICFALFARVPFPGLALKITARQLIPYLAQGTFAAFCLSHVKSRKAQREAANAPHPSGAPPSRIPHEIKPGWEACRVRNETGYTSLRILGEFFSIAIIAARAGLFVL